ncbi:LysR family transcriptional regulator [Novosphingobium capsulatum]|uniref:LysR family transcriptional regulator n=1 Tax=Novosphingobium capsulatum TaxID=13688 RepID=UPI002E105E5E|nr:LysR family transcriptional regulator [Novosphingobium capsulatum]WQD94858.1 LysR family transcriptional regulator [Novosphingobium capsulatum]
MGKLRHIATHGGYPATDHFHRRIQCVLAASGDEHRGARALREPKSKLSRRIVALEARLGMRLIERSSRRFRVTDVGQAFYERCRAMIGEA